MSITNPPGKDAYPIASFTWLLLYENPDDKAQAKIMVDFMKWALTDGQKFAKELGYAPLPKALVDMELKALGESQALGRCRLGLFGARSDEVIFRAGTGAFAVLLIVIVVAIGVELCASRCCRSSSSAGTSG